MNNRYRLLYDGACPVCRREILWLSRRRPDAIEPVDTSAPGFYAADFGLETQRVDAALYGIRPDGGVTVGMDSIREAYRLGGLGWMVAWTGLVAGASCIRCPVSRVRPQPYAHGAAAGAWERRLRRRLPVLINRYVGSVCIGQFDCLLLCKSMR